MIGMSETRSPSKSFSWASGNAFCPFLVSKRSKREEGGKKKIVLFPFFFFCAGQWGSLSVL